MHDNACYGSMPSMKPKRRMERKLSLRQAGRRCNGPGSELFCSPQGLQSSSSRQCCSVPFPQPPCARQSAASLEIRAVQRAGGVVCQRNGVGTCLNAYKHQRVERGALSSDRARQERKKPKPLSPLRQPTSLTSRSRSAKSSAPKGDSF